MGDFGWSREQAEVRPDMRDSLPGIRGISFIPRVFYPFSLLLEKTKVNSAEAGETRDNK